MVLKSDGFCFGQLLSLLPFGLEIIMRASLSKLIHLSTDFGGLEKKEHVLKNHSVALS